MSNSLSFSRAFSTARREKPDMTVGTPAYFSRMGGLRNGKPALRPSISSPVALLSTSNIHVKSAQAIAGTVPIEIRNISTSSSPDSVSSDDSIASFSSSASNATFLTDASSVDESPTCLEPEPNQLSHRKATSETSNGATPSSTEATDFVSAPKIPQRAPSHSKSAHETLHRKRSTQRMASVDIPRSSFDTSSSRQAVRQPTASSKPPTSAPSSAPHDAVRSSFDLIGQRSKPSPHVKIPSRETTTSSTATIMESAAESPFDSELAQLREIAQEFGQSVRTEEEDADVLHMEKHGLATFAAADYISEIQSLMHIIFADEQPVSKHLVGFF